MKKINVYDKSLNLIGYFKLDSLPLFVNHGNRYFKLDGGNYVQIDNPVYVPSLWSKE